MDQKRSKLRLARFLPFLIITGSVAAQETAPSMVFERDVMIPMRDGVKLAANIFRSDALALWQARRKMG
jgi:predicted acyl esterase